MHTATVPPMRPARSNAVVLRRARATVAGLACLLLTVAMHAAGGGGLDLISFTCCVPLAFALGSLLVKVRHRTLVLAGGLLGTQALMHLVLSATCTPSGSAASHPSDLAMLAAHVAAAVMAAVALRHADRIAEAWLRFVAALRRRLPEIVVADARSVSVVPALSPVICGRLAWSTAGSRGPPVH